VTIEARFQLARGDFSLEVDLTLPGSGVTAVFGPSGCGKSTLLRAIAGLERTTAGYLKVGDELWQDDDQFLAPHRRSLGYVFQEPSLFPHLNVRRNLEYGLKRLRKGANRVSMDRAVELLGIGRLLARDPQQLSGGEQQRVAIARALAVSPALLLLDEPLAGLDRQRKQEILPYLDKLQRELRIPMLYVSHSRNEVARLAEHMIVMNAGRVQASGPVTELFARLDLALAHDPDAETVIEATVMGHEPAYHINWLAFSGGRFAVAGEAIPAGRLVRLQILARDVSLTLAHQQDTSILNIFPATVEELDAHGIAQVNVRLKVGQTSLLSRITRKSVEALGLRPGASVYAQVKSVAVLV